MFIYLAQGSVEKFPEGGITRDETDRSQDIFLFDFIRLCKITPQVTAG